MTTPLLCPCPSDLQLLIDGRATDSQQIELTRHLDECPECQQTLEQLADCDSKVCELARNIDKSLPQLDSAYWVALKHLRAVSMETVVPQGRSTPDGQRLDLTRLDFLEPSTEGTSLGRLGHFEVIRVIGRGGMGVVLEAFDNRLRRPVAVKVLDAGDRNDDISKQRFCREARAAASITHENVVAVHQVERLESTGLSYIVMQLVKGETLEQRVHRVGRLPIRDVIRIGGEVLAGLAAAHELQLIHRDIKPANILIDETTGRVKLTDFGLARPADGDLRLTRTGMVAGTPLYMSPEQAQGLEVDAETDQFSVGSVLYELCAGQPAFTGANPLSILRSIADTQPQPIRELNPEVPEWLGDVIHRLMAKSPDERFASVSDVAELFEFHWLLLKTSSQNIPVAAVEMCESKHRAQRWSRAGAAAAIFAAGMVIGVVLMINLRTFENRSTAERLRDPSNAIANEPANPFLDGVPTVQSQSVLKANSGSVWSVVFSPDGDSLAMAVEDGTIRLWDVTEQRLTKTLNAHRGIVWLLTWSPDGSRFASSGDDGELHIWDSKTFEKTQTLEHPNAIRSLVWFADGRRIASSDRAGNLIVWDVDPGKKLLERKLESAVYSIALTNDGRTLATAGTDSVIRLWDPETLEERVTLSGHAGPVFALDFHPDNTKLASVGWDKKLHLWDVGSGTEINALDGHSGDAWFVDFAPDGESLVTAGQDAIAIQWDARSGRKTSVLAGHQAALHTVAFDHESRRIATGSRDGTVRIWQVQRDATP